MACSPIQVKQCPNLCVLSSRHKDILVVRTMNTSGGDLDVRITSYVYVIL